MRENHVRKLTIHPNAGMWPVSTWIALLEAARRTKDIHSAELSFGCLVQKDVK